MPKANKKVLLIIVTSTGENASPRIRYLLPNQQFGGIACEDLSFIGRKRAERRQPFWGNMILQSKKQYAIRGIPKNPAIRLSRTYRIIFFFKGGNHLVIRFLMERRTRNPRSQQSKPDSPLPKKAKYRLFPGVHQELFLLRRKRLFPRRFPFPAILTHRPPDTPGRSYRHSFGNSTLPCKAAPFPGSSGKHGP